jgi:hypothetical protein
MARSRKRARRLTDAYAFPGFRTWSIVQGVFGDPKARIVTLVRRSKKQSAEAAALLISRGTTAPGVGSAIWRLPTIASIWTWRFGASNVGAAVP